MDLVTDKKSILGYRDESEVEVYLKIFVAMPTMVPTCRNILNRGFDVAGYGERQYPTYESNIPFVLRYMIDQEIPGGNWLEMPAGTFSQRQPRQCVTECQAEFDIVYDSLVSHKPDGQWAKLAPLRILSFDIECMGRKGHFPEAEKDPVIQIANTVTLQGSKTPIIRNVFVLDTCNPIIGAEVLSFEREEDLLVAWAQFMRKCDPDVLTGYNVQNFDVPYLINRAKALKIHNKFNYWGRVTASQVKLKESTFQSSAFGKRENFEAAIEGRVMFDVLPYMLRNHKLSSYTLNNVSFEFLGQQKEDVHHSIISDLQVGSCTEQRGHRYA